MEGDDINNPIIIDTDSDEIWFEDSEEDIDIDSEELFEGGLEDEADVYYPRYPYKRKDDEQG